MAVDQDDTLWQWQKAGRGRGYDALAAGSRGRPMPWNRDPAILGVVKHLRLNKPYDEHGSSITRWMLEIDHDGGVVRHLGLGVSGDVQYRCGADEFGVWNDEIVFWDHALPASEQWRALAGKFDGHLISAAEFEDHWAAATSAPGEWPNARGLATRLMDWMQRVTRR